MTWRRVTQADVPLVEAFLKRHIETSVFLVTNLRRYGPDGGPEAYAMTYWMTGDPVSGVIAQSTTGTVMAQWPDAGDWAKAAAVLPAPVTGVIADGDQMQAFLATTGLTTAPTMLDADETLYALDLADLNAQPGPAQLRALTDADRGILVPWRTDYAVHTLGEPENTAPARAEAEITHFIAARSHRLLVDGEVALSMTGFNAVVDDLVQVGGVYTPPAERGRGLARRAVALHLEEARASGGTRAILFANDPSAMAAYKAVGFHSIGRFRLVTFTNPRVLA
ncbi:GNAT family N-acetyltransferase [Pseudooctadecabacter sp.]|uniref:GNAT family N-acetyltransferase n=1 Tax=Pseudooctadecabacter sp. TaxID=1966338 RepID=UPI0035C84D34